MPIKGILFENAYTVKMLKGTGFSRWSFFS